MDIFFGHEVSFGYGTESKATLAKLVPGSAFAQAVYRALSTGRTGKVDADSVTNIGLYLLHRFHGLRLMGSPGSMLRGDGMSELFLPDGPITDIPLDVILAGVEVAA